MTYDEWKTTAPVPVDDEPDYDDDCCYKCGGEGYIENDCFEDTCCCADPEASHGIRTCPVCRGKG